MTNASGQSNPAIECGNLGMRVAIVLSFLKKNTKKKNKTTI